MIFILTYPEAGWDCVRGVFEADSEEQVWNYIAEDRGITVEKAKDRYVVTERTIEKIY